MAEDNMQDRESAEDLLARAGLGLASGFCQFAAGWYLATIFLAVIGLPLGICWFIAEEPLATNDMGRFWGAVVVASTLILIVLAFVILGIVARQEPRRK